MSSWSWKGHRAWHETVAAYTFQRNLLTTKDTKEHKGMIFTLVFVLARARAISELISAIYRSG
jgi:hypothetical protein